MIVYSNRFQLKGTLTKKDLIELFIKNAGTNLINFKLSVSDIKEVPYIYKEGNKELSVYELKESDMFAIRAIYLDTNGTRITTDATLNARTMQLIVRENREATEQTKHMGGTGEIPRFVKALVRSDWLEEDYNLQIQEKPLGITRDNCQIIQDVINRKSIYSIPVVYITKDTEYDLPVSQYDIASLLQGSAHVLFESDPLVTERLKKATNDSNPYGGFIGIYFPAKTAKPKRVDPYRSETEADFKRYLVKTINEYHLRQEVKESETFDGIKNTYLDIKNQYLKEKHDEIVVENTDLYNEYGIKLE